MVPLSGGSSEQLATCLGQIQGTIAKGIKLNSSKSIGCLNQECPPISGFVVRSAIDIEGRSFGHQTETHLPSGRAQTLGSITLGLLNPRPLV